MKTKATLHFISGKLASGKTTLAKRLAEEFNAMLFSEDVWLSELFPRQIVTFTDYLERSARFRSAIGPHVRNLLRNGVSVVFDFAGNAPKKRAWVKALCEAENVIAVLHYVKASDELCKRRLQQRNRARPEGSQPTTDEEFEEITKYFVPPEPSERFGVKEYDADHLTDATR